MKIGTLLSRTSKGGGADSITGRYQKFFGDEIAVVVDVIDELEFTINAQVAGQRKHNSKIILLATGDGSTYAYSTIDFDSLWNIIV